MESILEHRRKSISLDLTIVIVNYNTCQLLLNCLESIYDSLVDVSLECIVVDNSSTDGSVEAVRRQFPQVRVLANTNNVYFSAGNNQGIAQAQGRYVLALNPDTVIRRSTLRQLIGQLDADPTIGAATTTMVFPDGKLQRICARFVTFDYLVFNYTFLGKLFSRRSVAYNTWLWYADWDRTTSRDVDVLPGSCMIALKETWEAVGGFDTRMLMYFSDDYISARIKSLGQRNVFLASDGIVHYEGASTRQRSRRSQNLYFHDLLAYTKLVFGPIAHLVLAVLLIPTRVVQALKG